MLYILAIVTDSLLLTVILFRSLLFQKSYEYHPCVTMRTPAEVDHFGLQKFSCRVRRLGKLWNDIVRFLNICIQSSIVNCLCINVSLNELCLNRFTSYAPVSQNENICVLCTHSVISNMQKKRELGYRYAYMLCQ